MNSVPVATGSAKKMRMDTSGIYSIAKLEPGLNDWVIKARVIKKENIRSWQNKKGVLFNMILMDNSGKIRATVFNELTKKFYDMIESDKMYYFSNCRIKKNDYTGSNELIFKDETVVQPCNDDDYANIPRIKYNFIPIADVAKLSLNSKVDIIGVCKFTSDVKEVPNKKTGKMLKLREIVLVDKTATINLTIWGDDCENVDFSSNPIIVIKSAKVGEFGGFKNISTVPDSVIKINPDIPEVHEMRKWFQQNSSEYLQIVDDDNEIFDAISDNVIQNLLSDTRKDTQDILETQETHQETNNNLSADAVAVPLPSTSSVDLPNKNLNSINAFGQLVVTELLDFADPDIVEDIKHDISNILYKYKKQSLKLLKAF